MAKLVIAGEQRDASDGGTMEIRNPATGEIVDRVPAATAADVDRAIDAADTA
jgi:acyl-CoA reductase-like NAD-dependent aldehyde dehydrogenase